MNKSVIKKLRIHKRDNYKCFYCGDRFHYCDLHVDHKIPKNDGGSTDDSNLTSACVRCNLTKGIYSIKQFLELARERSEFYLKEFSYYKKILNYCENSEQE